MKKITSEELLKDLKEVCEKVGYGVSTREYARLGKYTRRPFTRAFGSWKEALRRLGYEAQRGGTGYIRPVGIPIEIHDKFPRVKGDVIIIANDTHIPYHDVDLWNELIKVSKKLKAEKIVIAGDLWDFKGLYSKDIQTSQISWVKEVEESIKFVNDLKSHFSEITVLMGNHEWRLIRLLRDQVQAEELINLIYRDVKQIRFSPYSYCLINDWLLVNHPDRSRKVKLSLEEELADTYRKSIINTHSHRFGFGINDSGIEVVGEGLHLTIPETHEYKYKKLSVNSNWIQGFWIVIKDKIFPYIKHSRVYNPFLVRR